MEKRKDDFWLWVGNMAGVLAIGYVVLFWVMSWEV